MIALWRYVLLAMFVLYTNLSHAYDFKIDPTLTKQPLSGWADYCQRSGPPSMAGLKSCNFIAVPQDGLAVGFSDQTHYLRFKLTNSTMQIVERWLEVGHPRLQQVQLYQQLLSGEWVQVNSGQQIASNQRPIVTQRILLPINIHFHQSVTYVLAVRSETRIDLSMTLWDLPTYFVQESRYQFVQALAMGGLLLAMVFSFILFVKWKEWAALWLALSFCAEVLLDASYTGMLSAYFWPDDMPFNIHFHALFASLTIVFFLAFVKSFLFTEREFPILDLLILSVMILMFAAGIGSFFIGYGLAIKMVALLAVLGILVSSWVFFIAWRRGFGPAGYLLIGYLMLLTMIFYRSLSAMGFLPAYLLESVGFSWYFLLVAPTALLAMMKRYDTVQQALISTESEREAYATFLTSMSHELRSPVNRILNQARRADVQTIPVVKQEIDQASRHLLAMIDDILDYARTRSGKLQLEPESFSLSAFVASVMAEVEEPAKASNNNLSHDLLGFDDVDWFIGDERRLRQVLINLLSNANRYCRNGRVNLHVNLLSQTPKQAVIRFAVADTGYGMTKAEINRIFVPFVRLDKTRRLVNGVGMGLPISEQLLTLMGSAMQVTSQPNEGSEFSFILSLEKDSRHHTSATQDKPISRPEIDVLVELQYYVALGSITDIEHWITQMQQQHPEHAAFYAQLRMALELLDLDELKRLSS